MGSLPNEFETYMHAEGGQMCNDAARRKHHSAVKAVKFSRVSLAAVVEPLTLIANAAVRIGLGVTALFLIAGSLLAVPTAATTRRARDRRSRRPPA
jgi:hypothetical protein